MMAATTQVKDAKTKLWLWGLSALYLIGYFLLMKETKVCAPATDVFIRAQWFLGFWDQYFACRTINELGDALAGAFAPVAFIWLAGAVQIQSQELAAQRQELNETQEVMRQQLEVAKAQVEETKASTALFRKQTEMAEREHQLREEAEADLTLKSAVEYLPDRFLSLRIVGWYYYDGNKYANGERHDYIPDCAEERLPPGEKASENKNWWAEKRGRAFVWQRDLTVKLNIERLGRFVREFINDRGFGDFANWAEDQGGIEANRQILLDLIALSESASMRMRDAVTAMEIRAGIEQLDRLLAFCDRLHSNHLESERLLVPDEEI